MDIYSTSVDYDPSAEASQKFFAVVQNKMHWAAHGHTAAKVIAGRADSSKPNMGLTTWTGSRPRRTDVEVAKNYIPQDSRLAVSTALLACRIAACMRATDQIPALTGGLEEHHRRLVAACAIPPERLGGSGAGPAGFG